MAMVATLIAGLILFLTPYLWIVMTSFKTRLDVLSDTPVWFFTPTSEHYPTIFIDKNYLPLVWNSMFVAAFSTILSLAPPTCLPGMISPEKKTCSSSF